MKPPQPSTSSPGPAVPRRPATGPAPASSLYGGRPTRPREALAVGALGSLALLLSSTLIRAEATPRGDDLIYERMAQHPFATHTFPFAYRIGVPWLVHVLPFSHTFSFKLLAWLAAGGACSCAYLLMRHFGAPRKLAAALAIALALSPPLLVVTIRQGRNTDIATVFFMMAATLFVVQRRLALLAATLALGVLFREAELFILALAYALWAQRLWDARAAGRVLLVGAPAILVFLALHLSLHTVGETRVPGYGGSLLSQRITVIETGLGSLFLEARRMFSIYGPLWIAAPLALASMSFARRGLVLVAASLIAMTFALDWGRMILLSAPVFTPRGPTPSPGTRDGGRPR